MIGTKEIKQTEGQDISDEEYEKKIRKLVIAILTNDNKEASFKTSVSGEKLNIDVNGNFEGLIFAYGALTYSMSQKMGISMETIGNLGINVAEFVGQAIEQKATKQEDGSSQNTDSINDNDDDYDDDTVLPFSKTYGEVKEKCRKTDVDPNIDQSLWD